MAKEDIERQNMAMSNAESNNSLPHREGRGGSGGSDGLAGSSSTEYDASSIRHLSDIEHIRTRPGMYIGRLGDGSHSEDGIYVLLKEAIDNSIDEFRMNEGKRIEIDIDENLRVTLRDYGRGIPQEKMIEAVSQLNTGGKYDSKAFKKSVGMNGVGIKAVNFLSSRSVTRRKRPLMSAAPISSLNPTTRCSRIISSMMISWRRCCATILI